MVIDATTAIPDEGKTQKKDYRPVIFLSSDVFETMLCRFLMSKLTPELEYLQKTASNRVLWKILVYLMMIDTTTDLTDEGGVQNKNGRSVIVFS